jgi:hypothetical protein
MLPDWALSFKPASHNPAMAQDAFDELTLGVSGPGFGHRLA